ncbi:uncharacterized protein LOC108697894 isoform X2 [Xenopus laevis]|uniref:Uncharacterized protein LOC108697894 isoform X2 n=1 Tax=Xenopus laevis TaxID=8355 RepID=A0A8J0TGE3_XENLA|nr:uncharacterized protein LOC108697894 isoform X2 [Xenopus laevis]
MQTERVPVQETCTLGFFNLPKSVQETSNIISKADLVKKARLVILNENIKHAKLMEVYEEKSLPSTTNETEHQDTEEDIYQAENVHFDHLATDKEVEQQCLVEGGSKGENDAVEKLLDKETKGVQLLDTVEDGVTENLLDMPDKEKSHSDTRKNKHQQGTLEKVLDFGPEAEAVVDGRKQEKNCDTQMLHLGTEGIKEIPDFQLGISDSDKMLVSHGKNMEQQVHVKRERYKEKTHSENIGCENLHRLVTKKVKIHKEDVVVAANAKSEKKNNLENKSYKRKKPQASAIDKGYKAHSNSEKLAAPNASRQMITPKSPINPVWREYWVNGTDLLAQDLRIHNWKTFCSLTFNKTSQIKSCPDSSFAVLCSNTSLRFLVREPPVTTWYLEHGSCTECHGTTEKFVSGGQFNDTEMLQKYTSQPAISSPKPLQRNSTDISPAPGSDTPVSVLIVLSLFFFLAAPTTFCIIIKCFCVKTQPKNKNFLRHSTAPERVIVDGREESPLDPGESHELTSDRSAET